MRSDSATTAITLSLDASDPVSVLRYSLERRQFSDAAAIRLDPARLDTPAHVTFFEAASFMEHAPEQVHDAVISLLGALSSASLEVVLWLHSDGTHARFFYGVVDPADGVATPARNVLMANALESFLSGARVEPVSALADEHEARLEQLRSRKAAGAIVGIPAARAAGPRDSRLAQILDGLAGERYDVVVQCVPVPRQDLDHAETQIGQVADLAHRLDRQSISTSDSVAFTSSVSSTAGATFTHSEGTSSSTTETVTDPGTQDLAVRMGSMLGAALGGAIGSYVAPGVGTAAGAKLGASAGALVGRLVGRPPQVTNRQTGTSASTSSGTSLSRTDAESMATTAGRQLSLEITHRSASILESIAEAYLDRLRGARACGAWYVHAHVLADASPSVERVAHVIVGALRGDDSHGEPLAFVPFEAASTSMAMGPLFRPPVLAASPHPLLPHGEQPSTLLGSNELALWFAPPTRETAGVLVRRAVQFARFAPPPSRGRPIDVGLLVSHGRPLRGSPVALGTDTLCQHTFVAGTTGAGKTTTVRALLHRLQHLEPSVPFLVVEPAKAEYRELFDELRREGKQPLRLVLGPPRHEDELSFMLNPLRAPAGVPLGRHAEAIKILLRSCFDMQESLPQLLERVVFAAYEAFGFHDLTAPLPASDARRPFPTLAALNASIPGVGGSVTRVADVVGRLGYEPRVQGNLIAALTVRLESFERGVKKILFSDDEDRFAEILTRPCFLELHDLTEPDVRRFALGALLLRLSAEREAQRRRGEVVQGLRHLLVLEEAHHVLRDATGSGPAAELTRATNTLLSDAFAELRSSGQGILVADQSPAELVPAVLRNTATKLVHALYFENDCRAIGDAMGLDEAQRAELRRLAPGECVIAGPELPSPVMCRVEPHR